MTRRWFYATLITISLAGASACTVPSTTPPARGEPPAAPARPESALLLTWEGLVDGLDLIKFHQDQTWVNHQSHRPVRDIRCEFREPLAAVHFPVVLHPEEGRGRVRIIRQGDLLNAYTLLVEIDDTAFGGAGRYRFSIYAAPDPPPSPPAFQMFAEVDDDVVVSITGNRLSVYKISGRPMGQLKYYFARPEGLDPAKNYVLRVVEGRGTAELLPREETTREVRIRIQDPAKGSATYQLMLLPAEPPGP
jgi:hypothetical protein